jgi:hypothetical protein
VNPETASLRRDCAVERDGFEPEISLAVLPRTQSETPVPGATKNNKLHELLVWNWKAAREAVAEKAAA